MLVVRHLAPPASRPVRLLQAADRLGSGLAGAGATAERGAPTRGPLVEGVLRKARREKELAGCEEEGKQDTGAAGADLSLRLTVLFESDAFSHVKGAS